MKKFLLLLAVCLISVAVFGQKTKTYDLDPALTYIKSTAFYSSDTVSANQTPFYLKVNAEKPYVTVQNVKLVLDSISVPNHSIQLQGSIFGADWTSIGSPVVWSGTTADTTIIISNTSVNQYRSYRLAITGTSGKSKVRSFEFKQFQK